MNKLACIFIFFLCGIVQIPAQSNEYKQVKPRLFEFGIGYPISLTSSKTNFDSFINIGFQKPIREKYFMGLSLSPQFQFYSSADYALGSKIRIGKLVSTHKNISLDLGYTIYSERHKSFPGLALAFNYNKTNVYGFHLKYEELNSENAPQERNIIVGMHLRSLKSLSKPKNATAEGLAKDRPTTSLFAAGVGIAGVASLMGILAHIISQSR